MTEQEKMILWKIAREMRVIFYQNGKELCCVKGQIELEQLVSRFLAAIDAERAKQGAVAWARFDANGGLSGLFENESDGRKPLYLSPRGLDEQG